MAKSGRNRRSQYKSRAWTGSRKAVGTPTARKNDYFAWIRATQAAKNRREHRDSEQRDDV